MEALLARYLDGDLSVEEADRFLRALESDPGLEARLRAHEQLLVLAHQIPAATTSPGFTAGVMRKIWRHEGRLEGRQAGHGRPSSGRRLFRARWSGLLAAAAAVVLLFGAGRWSARHGLEGLAPTPQLSSPPAGLQVMPASWVAGAGGRADLVAVRLVYAPTDPGVRTVNVAGSFNDWNPQEVKLRAEGPVWSTLLILPRDSFEYMFVEDGKRWVSDPRASLTRDDGFGGKNAVLDLRL